MDSFILKFPPNAQFTDDELFDFCVANDGLRIERNNKGEIIIMYPLGSLTGNVHFRIYSALSKWYDKNPNAGYIFDSSAGFKLPDNAVLSPDAAFVKRQKWDNLTQQEKEKFAPLTPDFIIEVRSFSDSISQLQSKMKDWIRNGCRLAWLIDPIEQKAYVYKQDGLNKTIGSFSERLDGEDVLPGFELPLDLLK